MKDSYDKSINLLCATCGDSNFEMNEDRSWIKCPRCGREYLNGYNELVELNQERINNDIEQLKSEVKEDLQKDLKLMFKKALRNNKYFKFK